MHPCAGAVTIVMAIIVIVIVILAMAVVVAVAVAVAVAVDLLGAQCMTKEVRLLGWVKKVHCDCVGLPVSHEAGDEHVSPQRDPSQKEVPDVLDSFAQSPGKEEKDEEETHPGELQLIGRKGVAEHLNEADAHQHTANRIQTA